MKSGRLETMSAQNLIDCANRKSGYKLDGCSGGMFPDALQYVINNGGIDDEECYPYGANDRESCRYTQKCKAGTVATWRRIPPTEEALKEALAKHGPVLAAIHSNDDFFSYNSGIYDDPKCTNERAKINHGVLVVGYGNENGKDFWIVVSGTRLEQGGLSPARRPALPSLGLKVPMLIDTPSLAPLMGTKTACQP